jgi:hypothetical protein
MPEALSPVAAGVSFLLSLGANEAYRRLSDHAKRALGRKLDALLRDALEGTPQLGGHADAIMAAFQEWPWPPPEALATAIRKARRGLRAQCYSELAAEAADHFLRAASAHKDPRVREAVEAARIERKLDLLDARVQRLADRFAFHEQLDRRLLYSCAEWMNSGPGSKGVLAPYARPSMESLTVPAYEHPALAQLLGFLGEIADGTAPIPYVLLTGPAGSGKTTLALQAAWWSRPESTYYLNMDRIGTDRAAFTRALQSVAGHYDAGGESPPLVILDDLHRNQEAAGRIMEDLFGGRPERLCVLAVTRLPEDEAPPSAVPGELPRPLRGTNLVGFEDWQQRAEDAGQHLLVDDGFVALAEAVGRTLWRAENPDDEGFEAAHEASLEVARRSSILLYCQGMAVAAAAAATPVYPTSWWLAARLGGVGERLLDSIGTTYGAEMRQRVGGPLSVRPWLPVALVAAISGVDEVPVALQFLLDACASSDERQAMQGALDVLCEGGEVPYRVDPPFRLLALPHAGLAHVLAEALDRRPRLRKEVSPYLRRLCGGSRSSGRAAVHSYIEWLWRRVEARGSSVDQTWRLLLLVCARASWAFVDAHHLPRQARLELLTSVLAGPDAPAAAVSASALGACGDADAVDALIAALRHPNGEVRAEAAQALGKIGDPRAAEALIAALEDRYPSARSEAAWALGEVGDAEAVPALAACLADPAAEVAQLAWESLTMLAAGASEALYRALLNADLRVRARAVHRLRSLAEGAARAGAPSPPASDGPSP